MEIKSVKLNFILNAVRIFLGTFFILITTPYVTRVLGAENLGKVDYVTSIIQYFILFTALGVPNYGIREIARTRDSEYERTKVVLELGIILVVTTIFGYIILFFLLNKISNFKQIKTLILIMSTWILFNNIGFEWFYQGIENQIYITVRFIMIRLVVIVLMFLFVKTSNDYYTYGVIVVLMNSGSNILNLINIRKYISFKDIKLKDLNIFRHLKPILIIFAASLSISIYLQLDVVMLGNINDKIVAYYTVPNKLIRLVMILITALGTVLVPRISNCIKNKDVENYKKYINLSLKYILMISIPSLVGIFLLTDNIIYIMAGEKFIHSILTMRILVFILFIVGLAYFLGFQILYPHGLEKYYTYSVTIAAIINFIFNYIMIPKYYQNGAAIGTIIAELTGVIIMLYFTRNYLKDIEFYNLKNLKYFISAGIMGIVILVIKLFNLGNLITLLLSIFFGSIIYFIVLFLFREDIIILGFSILKNKFKIKQER